MASPSTAKPRPTALMKFMVTMAGTPASPTGNKASSQEIENVRVFVHIISETPTSDYGGDKKVLNPTAAKHAVGVTAGVLGLAEKLFDLYQNDEATFQAIASTGFVTYFAKYYCDSLKLAYKRSDDKDYADQCNSTVIGPNLEQMLSKTKKK
jgi:hypothetical protein